MSLNSSSPSKQANSSRGTALLKRERKRMQAGMRKERERRLHVKVVRTPVELIGNEEWRENIIEAALLRTFFFHPFTPFHKYILLYIYRYLKLIQYYIVVQYFTINITLYITSISPFFYII